MPGVVHLFGVLCLFAAAVLLIVVSVSLPVWKSVYFLDAVSGGEHLRMGNWGLCVANTCTKARLGYDLTLIDSSTFGTAEAAAAVVHGLTYALILHPIAAGFSLFALLFALGTHLVLGILASILSFIAFLITLVAFGIDLGLFVTAHHRLSSLGYSVTYSNALWLVLASVVLQLIASFTVCFTHKQNRRAANRDVASPAAGRGGWFARNRQAGGYNNGNGYNNGASNGVNAPVMGEKRHFWQRRTGGYQV